MRFDRPYAYLAAPLFNSNERQYNLAVADAIEAVVPVFLPQRDGALLADMVQAGVAASIAERRVFSQDCHAMQHAHALIAVLDGAHIDEGVAFEIGYMTALERVCVGLQTDVRRSLPTGNNPMLVGALSAVFANVDDLKDWLTIETRAWALPERRLA